MKKFFVEKYRPCETGGGKTKLLQARVYASWNDGSNADINNNISSICTTDDQA